MKITRSFLRKIIQEETNLAFEEGRPPEDVYEEHDGEEGGWIDLLVDKVNEFLLGKDATEEEIQLFHDKLNQMAKDLGPSPYDQFQEGALEEEKDFLQNVKSTGEWTDYTIPQLDKKKAALMRKKTRTKPEQKKVSQINFAINAKEGDYEKKEESLNRNRKRTTKEKALSMLEIKRRRSRARRKQNK